MTGIRNSYGAMPNNRRVDRVSERSDQSKDQQQQQNKDHKQDSDKRREDPPVIIGGQESKPQIQQVSAESLMLKVKEKTDPKPLA